MDPSLGCIYHEGVSSLNFSVIFILLSVYGAHLMKGHWKLPGGGEFQKPNILKTSIKLNWNFLHILKKSQEKLK